MSAKPISPTEIMDDLVNIIPSFVIEAVNNLLKEQYRGHSVTIKRDVLIAEIQRLSPDKPLSREEIFKKKWLDFETLFRENGWKVFFESPCRDENFEPYFKFEPKK